jgi:hypothetical protein
MSHVYSGSPVRDVNASESNDLIYIPTPTDLAGMTFASNTIGSTTYTAQQQKDAFEAFIQSNPYLRNNRGKFAERNGSRTPFTNIVDLKIAQDFNIKVGAKRYQFQLTYDVFNLGNMINRDWGRNYFQSNDNFPLLTFGGYVSATDFTPTNFKFNPTIKTPWSVSTSTNAAYSARWISQIGLRFNF